MQKKFAVFDIDGTLVRWQLFHAIVHSLGKHGFIDSASHDKIIHARMAWKTRNSSNAFREYEHTLLHTYLASLKHIKIADYHVVVDKVFDEYKDQLFVYTKELMEDLKVKGYVLFAVSGSQQEIVEKLAKYHGFTDSIGAILATKNGYFTGEIDTPVLNKRKAVEALIAKHSVSLQGSIAVGDTASDISMFELVENPIAFNPTTELFEVATKNHWPIVVERKNMVYHLNPQGAQYILQP